MELELDMTGIYAEAPESTLTFQFTANTSSVLMKDPSLTWHFPLARRTQLLLLGYVYCYSDST